MNARAKPPTDGEIIAGGIVASVMPLYRDQAMEAFGLAHRHAEIAWKCLECGDDEGATHATRKLIEYTRQASGLLKNINASNEVANKLEAERVEAAREQAKATREVRKSSVSPAPETEAA